MHSRFVTRVLKNSVLPLGLLACGLVMAADQHAPILAPQIMVGDNWTYQYTDVWKSEPGKLNKVEITAVNDGDIEADVKHAATGAVVSHQHFSREMNPIERHNIQFAPAFGRFAFPLEAGKQWSSEANGENAAAGKSLHYKFEGKALAWEKIKVQAGQFDALKIEVTAYYQGRKVGSNGSGKLTETLWYAPAVKNFVKLEYEDTDLKGRPYNRDLWELTAYESKPGGAN